MKELLVLLILFSLVVMGTYEWLYISTRFTHQFHTARQTHTRILSERQKNQLASGNQTVGLHSNRSVQIISSRSEHYNTTLNINSLPVQKTGKAVTSLTTSASSSTTTAPLTKSPRTSKSTTKSMPEASSSTTTLNATKASDTTLQSTSSLTTSATTSPVSTTTSRPPVLHSAQSTCRDPFRGQYTEKKNFICCHPTGGLGNALFVYASAYGIASYLNRSLVVDRKTWSGTYGYFNMTAKTVDDYECVIKGSKGMDSGLDSGFDKRLMELPKGDNYCVGMYIQSYKYFDHVKTDIRNQLTFRTEYRDKARGIIDRAIQTYYRRVGKTSNGSTTVVVGVHVRRGDLVHHSFGYDVATPEYMKKASQYFRTRYQNVLFLVCTNDMVWSKTHLRGDDVIYIEGNHFSIDLAVLVSCDHTLITVGTFGWWAGFLGKGETVYYQWPAKEGTQLRKQFSADFSDFFPPSWIGMK